ncbi:MAG: YhdP family protein [Woeseia sp.]
MKKLFKKILSLLAYLAAGGIILLAIAVGLFRLLLPRLPAHQEDIKGWAASAIGMEVEFSGMNARWRFSGPELNFYNAELKLPDDAEHTFAANEVSVGIDLMRLLLDRTFVIDSVLVRDAAITIGRNEAGEWLVQDIPLDTLASRFARGNGEGNMSVVAEDLDVSFRHPVNDQVVDFTVSNMRLTRTSRRLLIDSVVALPDSLGNRLSIGIVTRNVPGSDARIWQYSVDSRGLNVAGWSRLQPASWPQSASGSADISMSIEQFGAQIRNAVVEFDASNIAVSENAAPFGIEGRVDYQHAAGAWLLAADDFRLRTTRGDWPAARINVQGETDDDSKLTTLSASANYLDLLDLVELKPWLPAKLAKYLNDYQPSGQISDLTLTLTELQSERPVYDVALLLEDAGVAPFERLPGLRGFSGSLRANASGGRLEILSSAMSLDLSRWLPDPVLLDSAAGTVIWRRNQDGIIVLSDDVALQNQDIISHSNVQLSLPADGTAPVLDLESRWSIADLARARRYLPQQVINPPLYSWLQSALVGGNIPSGTTRFSGAIDKFPFDQGEGVFRIDATLADATLMYSDRWPAVENLNLDLIVDGTRLYSEKNTATNAGNAVVDAKIEIADLRAPVLTINSLATGTLESIRRFARESPIADVFGGRLDDVTVSGNASFVLELTYPIRNREAYDFTTRVQTTGGTLRVAGFPAPVSELNGLVTISRNSISSESLFGRFLGEQVNIDLRPAAEDSPGFSVVATVNGRATVAGLEAAFGAQLAEIIEGSTNYTASLQFPRSESEAPSPFTIDIRSQMEGLAILLPAPLMKPADAAETLYASIILPAEGVIETNGSLGDDKSWALAFRKDAGNWDFDRGGLALGGADPGAIETRGLHITGNLPELKLSDWLEKNPADGGRRGGIAARIRSLDITVQRLEVLGQQFGEHHLLVSRSGNDWLVQIEGAEAEGSLAIPYDFAGGRTLTLDMQRLVLPGSDAEEPGAPINSDPRELPSISLKAQEFAFGDRYLGRVSADFEVTADGLVANAIETQDRTFSVKGAAGWVVDTQEPMGQKTWVKAQLISNDVAETLKRLDSQPGIVGKDMDVSFDVSWPGGPREDFLDGLDGNVVVRFGTGQLDEVEPGAGRMFGLMSVVALPRRLALDFRDVLDKGFLFDEITGTFSLVNGDAFTCDLSLKGPAADIGIVGRAGLQAKDYTQTALVSANVGNTLPVVGAVVAGPQVAAALLIFSQIFKKPLQEMGQAYYAIDGSWDNPEVESADAARFAVSSREANCLPTQ